MAWCGTVRCVHFVSPNHIFEVILGCSGCHFGTLWLHFGDLGLPTLGISPRPGAGVYFLLFCGALWVPVGHPFRSIFCSVCDFGCQKLRFGCRPVFLWFGRWKSDLSGVAVCGENTVNMYVFERFHFLHKSCFLDLLESLLEVILETFGSLWGSLLLF